MAFVNEVVSDQDIDRYGLPFEKGAGRWWTRDAERDFYLWGGKVGNPAFGVDFEGQFHLFINGKCHLVRLAPGLGSFRLSDRPFLVRWSGVKDVEPAVLLESEKEYFLSILKESLRVYGRTGRGLVEPSLVDVVFDF